MKRIIVVTCVAVVAAFAGYNMYSINANKNLSNLLLANVEALADNSESSGSYDCCNTCSGNFCGTFTPSGSSSNIRVYYN